MPLYKITFTPSGPYFFGNEKSFAFDSQKKSMPLYFIKGEKMPYQTTLFGTLRYILLPKKGFGHLGNTENVNAVGKDSFDIEYNDSVPQSFGSIKKMSAVLLCRGDELFIPTPFDHNTASENDEYTPFTEFAALTTPDTGFSFYPVGYNSKKGLADSYTSLSDLHLETELFTSDVRIGINRSNTKEGFFKREFICLKKGFSFCVFAEIDNAELDGRSEAVTMGQNKVPFAVRFENADGFDLTGCIEKAFSKKPVCKDRIYCLSDAKAADDLYGGHSYAIVKTRDFRNLKTTQKRFVKSESLHHLISAGSVFFPKENVSSISRSTNSQKNAETVGFNHVITVKGVAQ